MMIKKNSWRFAAMCALSATVISTASAQRGGEVYKGEDDGGLAGTGIPEMDTTRVASGLVRPIFATYAPGDTTRLFIIEKQGRIRVLKIDQNPPVLLATPFLDIDAITTGGTTTGSEQGLLGLAFHPNYQSNGIYFVYYTSTSPAGANTLARYQVSGNPDISGTTGTILFQQADTEANHNGGWLGFSPNDGYLYVAMGDGGGANDAHGTTGNGQNINTRFGKILRLDVDGADNIVGNDDDDGTVGNGITANYSSPSTNPFFGATPGLDEIWAYGLRNSWRCSFDRQTGDLYIADVGQDAWEEINIQPASSLGGENYGWRCMEGNNSTGLSGCTAEIGCAGGPLTCPNYQYSHGTDGFSCSVTGGYVYRGTAISGLQGHYFFADYCSDNIRTFLYSGGVVSSVVNRTTELAPGGGLNILSITSFGEDAAGEIYICDQDGGEVFKIIPAPLPAPANNTCASAAVAVVGSVAFTTVNATTDGPNETTACNFGGVTQIDNDVWYKIIAPCTGTMTVDTCSASFNTRLAAYAACPTIAGSSLACNDDSCGDDAVITFPVNQSTIYYIRVGGHLGATGTGTLTISCDAPPACPADITGEGHVEIGDLLICLGTWGCTGVCDADVNGDLVVDIADLLLILGTWGPCGP